MPARQRSSMSRLAVLIGLGVLILRADLVSDRLIRSVENRYNGARTLSVNFVEHYSIQGHARPPEEGTLILRKQGKMRWEYARPAGKLFISDGKTVYLYTQTDNRVEKVAMKDTEDMRAPLGFLLGRLDMRKEFRGFTTRPGEGGSWLDAEAKNDRAPYERVEMLIAGDGSVRQLKVVGRDQSVLEYSFSSEQLNPVVSDKMFRFAIPPGAEVVDSVELSEQER